MLVDRRSLRLQAMGIDHAVAGAIIGFALSVLEAVALFVVAGRVERHAGTPTAGQSARLLRVVAVVGVVLGTGLGYVIGLMIG